MSSVLSHETHIRNGCLETTYQVTWSPAPGGQSGTDARGRGLSAGGTRHWVSPGSGRGPLASQALRIPGSVSQNVLEETADLWGFVALSQEKGSVVK